MAESDHIAPGYQNTVVATDHFYSDLDQSLISSVDKTKHLNDLCIYQKYTANTQQAAVSPNVVTFVSFGLSVSSGHFYYP